VTAIGTLRLAHRSVPSSAFLHKPIMRVWVCQARSPGIQQPSRHRATDTPGKQSMEVPPKLALSVASTRAHDPTAFSTSASPVLRIFGKSFRQT
jgi:hypothetical protein